MADSTYLLIIGKIKMLVTCATHPVPRLHFPQLRIRFVLIRPNPADARLEAAAAPRQFMQRRNDPLDDVESFLFRLRRRDRLQQ